MTPPPAFKLLLNYIGIKLEKNNSGFEENWYNGNNFHRSNIKTNM
jgi:hypothetical protein